MSYAKAHEFGFTSNLPIYNNDPLTYCVGTTLSQAFNHPASWLSIGQNSSPCQIYMASRCAQNWDNICEYVSNQSHYEDVAVQISSQSHGMYLNPGEILIVNTAQKKYLVKMLGNNCELKTEQFDPVSIGGSPFISSYIGNCYPIYFVDAKIIDYDPVMNKILDKPWIAKDFLSKLRMNMIQFGKFETLKGTRLGLFYGIF
jgi:hypothetical protein